MAKQDWAVLPFNSKKIKNKYLVSTLWGSWSILEEEEFKTISSLRIDRESPLFKRLYNERLVIDKRNIGTLIADYRNINANLFCDTSLHIAILTTRCNLNCRYCQTNHPQKEDMNYEVASRILKYIYDVKTPNVTLEFQGGEPLLNWEVLSFLTEHARKFNTIGKNLKIALVSNLTLLDKKKIDFFIEYDVEICTSLDGPKKIHDKIRVFKNGSGSYDNVIKNIEKIKKEYKKRKLNKKINLLPTITRFTLPYFKEIIDEYVKLEQDEVAIRPVNRVNIAELNWRYIGYSPEDFITFWKEAFDYILELNKKGVCIKERVARCMLDKILGKRDSMYMELMNPCGAGRTTIAYMPNGDAYPCDEARMIGSELFKLGNILKENYEDLVKSETLFNTCQASLLNLWDYRSCFLPWSGSCPVLNYHFQQNIIPKITSTFLQKIYNLQFQYLFEKMIEGEENLKIFKNWVNK